MPIQHKFYQYNFINGFQTHNAILDNTPHYKPKIMFIGTFNPDIDGNFADFFYGRNYFWPAFNNLFVHNQVHLTGRRMPPHGGPAEALNPDIDGILNLCARLKLTFADLILEVLPNCNSNEEIEGLNLISDSGLEQLAALGQINWNTQNIIDYLCENTQIKTIYFTRRPVGIWQEQWNLIINHKCMQERKVTNIFTPSGAGKPVYHSMARLLNHWVHNNSQEFGNLDNNWLENYGVTLENF